MNMYRFNAIVKNGKGLPYNVRILANNLKDAHSKAEQSGLSQNLIQIIKVNGLDSGNFEYQI